MEKLFRCGVILIVFTLIIGCNSKTKSDNKNLQTVINDTAKIIGGGCDGCEIMYIGMPENINSVDTSSGWSENGQKLLITGTVFKRDGKTPAGDVIIYYWQTDNEGYYSPKTGMDEKAKRHGHIRGWIKSDKSGKYSIYTIRPAPYPNEETPAHIHLSVKEPEIKNEYYIDEFVFDDDKFLTGEKRKAVENRGGSGVLRVLISEDLQIAEHNIVLGLNIPDYPVTLENEKQSGLQIGEDNPSFTPFHAFGPDKGSKACPVCKYGRYFGIIYFVGNHPDWEDIKKWLTFFDQESQVRGKYLKVYFVYGNENEYQKEKREVELQQIGSELKLLNVALTFVPSLTDKESEVNLNKINPEVKNTIIIYRQRTIIDKYIDHNPTPENFNLINNILENSKSEYFNLEEPKHE